MMETGDWVTPRLYGQPWFEKPVLLYWGAALSFELFGVTDAAARVPSAVSALLATLALAWLAWRLYGADAARWLLLLMPTTVGMLGFSHAAATDMPFSAMLTLAMVSAAFVLGLVRDEHTSILPRTPWLALLLFGFFLGLAVLAKGPAAIVLSGGAILLWALSTHRWRDAFRCLHPVAIASFCLTALPWYVLCARRNPDFFRVFIIEHNFKRYLTPEFQHIQPFWFYIPISFIALFPWTILLIPAAKHVFEAVRRNSVIPSLPAQAGNATTLSSLPLFFLCWAAFPLVFFSVSQSKLPGYILPAIPPLVLLLTTSLAARLRPAEKPPRWLTAALGAGLIGFATALSVSSGKLPPYTNISPPPEIRSLELAALLGGATVIALAVFHRVRIAVSAMVLFVLLLVVETDAVLGRLDPALTARNALVAASRLSPQFSSKDAATWQLKRSLAFQLNFYMHSVLPEWKPEEPKPAWLFIQPEHAPQAAALGFDCGNCLYHPAVIPCRNNASVGGLSTLGGSSDNLVRDRQPR